MHVCLTAEVGSSSRVSCLGGALEVVGTGQVVFRVGFCIVILGYVASPVGLCSGVEGAKALVLNEPVIKGEEGPKRSWIKLSLQGEKCLAFPQESLSTVSTHQAGCTGPAPPAPHLWNLEKTARARICQWPHSKWIWDLGLRASCPNPQAVALPPQPAPPRAACSLVETSPALFRPGSGVSEREERDREYGIEVGTEAGFRA